VPVLIAGLACAPKAPEPAGAASATGMGLVVTSDDPAHAGKTPEELEELGVRLYYHDFGNVPLGDSARHVFHLKNTDAAPVLVTRMQPTCSCTIAELSFQAADGSPARIKSSAHAGDPTPIPPGAAVELAFTIDTAHSEQTSHNTDKLYSVQVVTSSENRAYLRFEGHIVIERAFQATPQPLDLGRIPRNGGATGEVEIIPVGDSGASLVGVGKLPPGVRADLIAEPLYGSTLWTLQVTLEPPLAPGPVLQRFDLMAEDTEGLPYPPFPIEVHAYAVEDVDWSPQRFLMRNASVADRPLEATIELYSLLAGDRLLVTGAHLEGEGTERLALKFEPNLRDAAGRSERWTLRLTPQQPFGDRIVRGKAVVELEGRDPLAIELLVRPE
jgi:hypothetical protein